MAAFTMNEENGFSALEIESMNVVFWKVLPIWDGSFEGLREAIRMCVWKSCLSADNVIRIYC